MRSIVAFAMLLFACHEDEPVGSIVSATPNRPTFTMAERDRRLRNIEGRLSDLGFKDTARIYEGPAFSLVAVRVPGERALEAWQHLRADLDRTGAWPVIVGERAHEDALVEHLGRSSASVIEQSIRDGESLNFGEWLDVRRRSDEETYALPRVSAWKRSSRERCAPNTQVTSHTDISTSKEYRTVSIVLVPTTKSWQVPGFLQIGGWNDCPAPSEHVSAIQSWQRRFGAELLGLRGDTVELAARRPVADEATALLIAKEHFIYNYDIVHQGTRTLDCLADTIKGGAVWFFWWD